MFRTRFSSPSLVHGCQTRALSTMTARWAYASPSIGSSTAVTSSVVWTQQRAQHQARGRQHVYDQEGNLRAPFTVAGNQKKLNPKAMNPNLKSAIQKERRDLGLSEIDDWAEFAETAYWLRTIHGGTFIGPDDPRASRVMRRKSKAEQKPGQVARSKPGKDPAKELEDHFFRKYFVSPQDTNNPLEVAEGLWKAGYIKEFDVKHTAANMVWKPRAPVISIMGHVDHGKTTLLDYLRQSNVASGEAGGITQSIGAFAVTRGEEKITFIDTPGHAAFTTMREAGAELTDIVVLIVSVVDGVQPQTLEVIEMVKKRGVPMVVALNKVDRAEQNISKVKKQLMEAGVELEEEGGDVLLTPISALTGQGVDELLDNLLLQASMCECQTPEISRVEVSVIDSKTPEDTPLIAGIVKSGTLKPGMTLVTGTIYGVVLKLYDETGKNPIKSAGVGTPIYFSGHKVPPKPGVTMMQVSSKQHGERYSLFMQEVFIIEGKRETYFQQMSQDSRGLIYRRKNDWDNEQHYDNIEYKVVVRAGTFGQLQALLSLIYDLPHVEGTHLRIIKTEVGGSNNADNLELQRIAGRGCILSFGDVKDYSSFEVPGNVDQMYFQVVYHGVQWLKERIVGCLPKERVEDKISTSKCLQVFKASQAGEGNAAGMVVQKGKLKADAPLFRVYRVLEKGEEPEVVYEGGIKELRRFKDIVPSVEKGLECGVILHDGFQFLPGDMFYEVKIREVDRDVDEVYQEAQVKEDEARRRARQKAEEEDEAAALNGGDSTPEEDAEVA